MTWGIDYTVHFGTSFPAGNYQDWEAKCQNHFDNVLTEDERNALGYGVNALLHAVSLKFRVGGKRVFDFEQPTVFRTRKAYKKLTSLIQLNDGLFAVSEDLMDIIEKLEPGIHQFWPIRIIMPKGIEFSIQYYAIIINTHICAFSREGSKPGSWEALEADESISCPKDDKKENISDLAIRKDKVEGAHIWLDRTLLSPEIFLSNQLVAEIQDRNLTLPKNIYRMIDV